MAFIMDGETRLEVILEEVREQYRVLKEGLDNLRDVPERLARLENDMSGVKSSLEVITLAVQQHSIDIAELKAAA